MHNAFYVFTLQNERKRNPSLSRSRVVETYVLFKEVKRARKHTHLHKNTYTQDIKNRMLPRRERETDLAKKDKKNIVRM